VSRSTLPGTKPRYTPKTCLSPGGIPEHPARHEASTHPKTMPFSQGAPEHLTRHEASLNPWSKKGTNPANVE
jgi:hypothetical protein